MVQGTPAATTGLWHCGCPDSKNSNDRHSLEGNEAPAPEMGGMPTNQVQRVSYLQA